MRMGGRVSCDGCRGSAVFRTVISAVVFYDYEMWYLTMRAGRRIVGDNEDGVRTMNLGRRINRMVEKIG